MKKYYMIVISIMLILGLEACVGDFKYYNVGEIKTENIQDSSIIESKLDNTNTETNIDDFNIKDYVNSPRYNEPVSIDGYLDITYARVTEDDFSDGRVFQNIEYPNLNCTNNDYIDAQLKKLTDEYKDEVIQFRDENKDLVRDMVFNDTSEDQYFKDLQYSYTIEAEVVTNDENYLSILKKTYMFTGGAHPSYFINAVTFDLKNKKETDLYDFVKDKEELRAFLKDYVAKNKDDMYEDADKTIDNYIDNPPNEYNLDYHIDYYLQNRDLHIVFQAYELAPYAVGIIDIIADKNLLKVDL